MEEEALGNCRGSYRFCPCVYLSQKPRWFGRQLSQALVSHSFISFGGSWLMEGLDFQDALRVLHLGALSDEEDQGF